MNTPLAPAIGHILNIHPTIRQDLTKLELCIFEEIAYLSYQADKRGRSYITPGYQYLATRVGCCTKTIQRAMEKFVALGLVRKQRRNPQGRGRWRTNLYQVSSAVRRWMRDFYQRSRRTFLSTKPSKNINYQVKEEKKSQNGDSTPLSATAKEARDRLLRLTRRAQAP